MNAIEKIIATHAGLETVIPGQIVGKEVSVQSLPEALQENRVFMRIFVVFCPFLDHNFG